MAVQFDGTADEFLYSTAGLPASSVFSVSLWTYISVDRNAYSTQFSLTDNVSDGAGNGVFIQTETDGTSMRVFDSWGGSINGGAMSTSAWYFMCFVLAGTGASQAALHYAALGDTSLTKASATFGTSFTPARLSIGDSAYNEPLNGRVSDFIVYSSALSDAAVLEQFKRRRPIAECNRWYPMIGASVADCCKDYSGNGRDLTSAGTLAVADSPAIGFGSLGMMGVG